MWPVLNKVFVRSFYKANTGFFLFFFFLFFGAVEGGSLISYHLSLMQGMLRSGLTLSVVLCCWILYHVKCTAFFLRVLNSTEGVFLSHLQAIKKWHLAGCLLLLYLGVYAPVFVYGLLVAAVGIKQGFVASAISILLFQLFSPGIFTAIAFYRATHWLETIRLPAIHLSFPKTPLTYVLFHFLRQRRNLLLLLKVFCLLLLYIILVWNRGKYDNDSFLLFYLVLLLAHAVVPYLAVQFLEKDFASYRNIPLSLLQRGAMFLTSYSLLLLPEVLYLFYAGNGLPLLHRLAYSINLLASLAFLTAIQYSEAQSREEYMKACFGLVLVSIFFLHVQGFALWISAQFVIATLLFSSGYYSFERNES